MQSKKINELGTNLSPSIYDLTVVGDAATGQLKKITLNQIASLFGSVGGVSSVAMTVPTGLTVTGSPITTSGTLAVTLSAGYSIPTTAKQSEWDTGYADRLKWDGGTSGLNAATARTSLGLVIGTDVLAYRTFGSAANNNTGDFATAAQGTNADTAYNLRLTGASAPLSISSNVISISQANTSTDGYLSSDDWTTFDNKVSTGREIATTAPLQGGGNLSGDRTLSITQSNTTTDGYLSATDWTTFNSKQNAISLTANRAVNTGSTGQLVASITTATELSYLNGVTSNVQTQLDAKAGTFTLGSVSSSPTSVLVITGSGAPVNGSLTFTVNLASGSQNGYLSSTDWTTFNNKQAALGFTPYNATNPDGFITSSGTAAAVSKTVSGTTSAELVRGNMADNDQFRILVGGTGTNAGYAEIATADDGTEPIYVRQYTGVFSTLVRTATLLDGSGNTSFPNNLSAANFSGSSSGTNTGDQTLAGLGGQPQLNGTGFVKASGTTITYDNSTYLTTSSAASTYLTISNASSTYLTISNASSTYLSISNASSTYFPFSGGTISGATTITALLTNYNTYNTQTSSYTLVLSDASKIVEMNVGSANTVTVPANASVAFPIGTEITVMQYGAGNTTIVAASGVTFRSKDFSTRIGDQYTGATLIKRDTNEWYLIGNILP